MILLYHIWLVGHIVIFFMSFGLDSVRVWISKFKQRMENGKATVLIRRKLGGYGFIFGRYAIVLPFSLGVLATIWTSSTELECSICSFLYWVLLGIINIIDWFTSGPRKRRLRKWASERVEKLLGEMGRRSRGKTIPVPA